MNFERKSAEIVFISGFMDSFRGRRLLSTPSGNVPSGSWPECDAIPPNSPVGMIFAKEATLILKTCRIALAD